MLSCCLANIRHTCLKYADKKIMKLSFNPFSTCSESCKIFMLSIYFYGFLDVIFTEPFQCASTYINAVSFGSVMKYAKFQDSFHPIITQMSKKVSWMTGLNTDTWKDDAELLQVANYINGGHYSPHHDYVLKEKDPDNVRLEHSPLSFNKI